MNKIKYLAVGTLKPKIKETIFLEPVFTNLNGNYFVQVNNPLFGHGALDKYNFVEIDEGRNPIIKFDIHEIVEYGNYGHEEKAIAFLDNKDNITLGPANNEFIKNKAYSLIFSNLIVIDDKIKLGKLVNLPEERMEKLLEMKKTGKVS